MRAQSVPQSEPLLSDLSELFKARLSFLVLLTTMVGFLLGWKGPLNYGLMAATLIGTAMCAAGASALNQWWERDTDALMKRTRNRPLSSGRMNPRDALLLGILCCIGGVAVLAVFTNLRATFLAFATIAIYVAIYTPLKRMTSLNTLVGAIPGALPPLIGWLAARESYQLEGCLLFAILWFWQMPHFLAIAWMYREDYQAGGYVMLSGNDPDGVMTARQGFLYSMCLVLISLMPGLLGFVSVWGFWGALVCGLIFVWYAAKFLQQRSRGRARALFFASIFYLPVLLAILVATRT